MNGEPVSFRQAVQADIANNKMMAVLAYILFFIPLIAAKRSKFAMYHVNQGLALFFTAITINIVSSLIPAIGWLPIAPLANLGLFILAVIGIIHASGGRYMPLPLIGEFQLIQH